MERHYDEYYINVPSPLNIIFGISIALSSQEGLFAFKCVETEKSDQYISIDLLPNKDYLTVLLN